MKSCGMYFKKMKNSKWYKNYESVPFIEKQPSRALNYSPTIMSLISLTRLLSVGVASLGN